MAPEQALGHSKEVGPAADVYALGAILYELLTGRPPFQGESALDVLLQVRAQEAVPPGALRAGLPRDLETVCLKCLQKQPGQRYPTAEALAEELRRFLEGRPVLARPVGPAEKLWRWCRRNPWVAGLTAAVALSLLAGIGVSTLLAVWATDRAAAAKTQEALARQETARATLGEQRTRRGKYVSDLRLVQREWEQAQVERVRELLDQQVPGPAGEDLRGFEWFYWWRLAHFDLLTIRGHNQPVTSVAYSPDAATPRLASIGQDGTVRVWDADVTREIPGRLGRQERALPAHLKGGVEFLVAFGLKGRLLASAGRQEVKVWDTTTGSAVVHVPKLSAGIRAIAFSPDGRRLAGALDNGTVLGWDPRAGQQTFTLGGHKGSARTVAFSPDSTRLATGGTDATVRLWDVATAGEILTLRTPGSNTYALAFGPDGRRLATTGTGMRAAVRVWDLTTGKEVFLRETGSGAGLTVAFSPDGTRLATAGGRASLVGIPGEVKTWEGEIKVWDARTGQEIGVLNGHGAGVTAVAFSPDGRRLASASHDHAIKVWDVAADARPRTFLAAPVGSLKRHLFRGLAFSPDGRSLAGGAEQGMVKVFDLGTGQEVRALSGHTLNVNRVAFSPAGQLLASSGSVVDSAPGGIRRELKVWEVRTGREALSLPTRAGCFSPDGKHLACEQDEAVEVWDTTTGRKLFSFPASAGSTADLAYSPDGKRLAGTNGSRTLRVWNTDNTEETPGRFGAEVLRIEGPKESNFFCVAYSPDGKYLAAGGLDRTVRVWDAASGDEVFTLKGHRNEVSWVAFSPLSSPSQTGGARRSSRLASVGNDGTVRVWDLFTGQEILTFQEPIRVCDVAFSPDGKHLAVSLEDGSLKVWDAAPGR
jgi:WD40 repeat protein